MGVASVDAAGGTLTLSNGTVVRVTAATTMDPEGDLLTLESAAAAVAGGSPVRAEGRRRGRIVRFTGGDRGEQPQDRSRRLTDSRPDAPEVATQPPPARHLFKLGMRSSRTETWVTYEPVHFPGRDLRHRAPQDAERMGPLHRRRPGLPPGAAGPHAAGAHGPPVRLRGHLDAAHARHRHRSAAAAGARGPSRFPGALRRRVRPPSGAAAGDARRVVRGRRPGSSMCPDPGRGC